MKYFGAVVMFVNLMLIVSAVTAAGLTNRHREIFAESSGAVANCNYYCGKNVLPICGSNGQCMQMFTSECGMNAYNCENPQKPFVIIEEWKCRQSWSPICTQRELRNQ